MSDRPYRIVLVEDHVILRDGLRALLADDTGLTVVGEASDGIEAVRRVEKLTPDLVLVDLSLPKRNGIEVIREIKKCRPATRVIVLTAHKVEEYVWATLQAGAEGYVLKDGGYTELRLAIQSVLSGKRYLSPGISGKVIDGYLSSKVDERPKTAWDALTYREREILKLIAEGNKNKDIAEQLFISIKTVEKHRSNLMKKLGLRNAAEVTTYALENGVINLSPPFLPKRKR